MPKQDKLQKIADFFHVSVDYLMTGKEPEEDIYTDNRLRKLNKELRNNTEFYMVNMDHIQSAGDNFIMDSGALSR